MDGECSSTPSSYTFSRQWLVFLLIKVTDIPYQKKKRVVSQKKKKKINEVGINNPSRAINLLFHIHVGVCNFFFRE